MTPPTIRRISNEHFAAHAAALCELLRDSVDGGASVGFLPPLELAVARAYWDTIDHDLAKGTRVLLAAFDDDLLVGSAQLDLCMRPNGAHRAEVSKLLVHSRARRRGIAALLMTAIEKEARARGRSTLVLDTLKGHAAEALYQRWGWSRVGEIPAFARVGTGALEPTVVFYKLLGE